MKQKLTVKQIAKIAVPILKRNDVVKAGVFGSHARGEAKKKSDVDMLIQFSRRRRKSYLDLVGLEIELKESIGRDVDLVTYNSLNPLLREHILKEEVSIV
jgi:uncharacterized protein